jgi:hypothetical protein
MLGTRFACRTALIIRGVLESRTGQSRPRQPESTKTSSAMLHVYGRGASSHGQKIETLKPTMPVDFALPPHSRNCGSQREGQSGSGACMGSETGAPGALTRNNKIVPEAL